VQPGRKTGKTVPGYAFHPENGTMPMGIYQVATDKTSAFLRANPDAPLYQPSTYADYLSELYRLVSLGKANADQMFNLSTAFDFPAIALAWLSQELD
jgi:hypothetical protein